MSIDEMYKLLKTGFANSSEMSRIAAKLREQEAQINKERSDICCYLLDIRDLQADLANKEARVWELEGLAVDQANILKLRDAKLQAAESLVRLVERSSMADNFETEIDAYHAAGKGNTK